MESKTYLIDGIKFTLKIDLTLDESEEVTSLLTGFYAPDKNTIAGKFTGAQIKRFLEIVLESEKTLPGDFSFGKTKESVQLEVFKDFFIERVSKAMNTANAFADSIKQQ